MDGRTDGQTDIQTDTQKFGGYNIIHIKCQNTKMVESTNSTDPDEVVHESPHPETLFAL